jgi:hypothetical protein
VKIATDRLRHLLEEVRVRGGAVDGGILHAAWQADNASCVELADSSWQQLTKICQDLGILVPKDLIPKQPGPRYYRGCRG